MINSIELKYVSELIGGRYRDFTAIVNGAEIKGTARFILGRQQDYTARYRLYFQEPSINSKSPGYKTLREELLITMTQSNGDMLSTEQVVPRKKKNATA